MFAASMFWYATFVLQGLFWCRTVAAYCEPNNGVAMQCSGSAKDDAFFCCGRTCESCTTERCCNHFCCWVDDGDDDSGDGFDGGQGLGAAAVAVVFLALGGLAVCIFCVYYHKKSPRPLYLDAMERRGELGSESEDDDEEPLPYGAACPPYWQNQDLETAFDDRYDVPKSVKACIQKMLDETWKDIQTRDRKGPVPLRLEVVNVQRIEDRNLWADYLIQKEKIRGARRQCQPLQAISSGDCLTSVSGGQLLGGVVETGLNEFYLWHGTSPDGAHGISEDGFQIALSGTHAGSMFGKGAYFAECSSKADEYSYEGHGIYAGIYAMLLCRVCCGEMQRFFRSDVPAIEKALKSGVCDSILGDREASVGTYREFVVFRERQIYPEYVVLYRRINEDSD